MTDTTLDSFDVIRGELLRATRRDVTRSRHHVRVMRVALASVGALVLLTGIAAAASERVADRIQRASEGVLDVFHGAPNDAEPMPWDASIMASMSEHLGLGPMEGKVLLQAHVNDYDVEITGYRDQSNPESGVCYTVRTKGDPNFRGVASCTGGFTPGLPINYGGAQASQGNPFRIYYYVNGFTKDGVRQVVVVNASGRHDALMGDHVFFFRTTERTTSLGVIMEDGTVYRQDRPHAGRDRPDPTVTPPAGSSAAPR